MSDAEMNQFSVGHEWTAYMCSHITYIWNVPSNGHLLHMKRQTENGQIRVCLHTAATATSGAVSRG